METKKNPRYQKLHGAIGVTAAPPSLDGSATGHDISLRCTAKSQLRTDKGLRERTEQLDILLFSAHHSVVFYFR